MWVIMILMRIRMTYGQSLLCFFGEAILYIFYFIFRKENIFSSLRFLTIEIILLVFFTNCSIKMRSR